MCGLAHCIRDFLFVPFPPLDSRAKGWLDSELSKPQIDLAHWIEVIADKMDEEQNSC